MLDVTIQNYRCFVQPAKLRIRPGTTALVGVNNSGKSSLLRLWYELRNMLSVLQNPNGNLLGVIQGQRTGFSPTGTTDPKELFPREGDKDIQISFAFDAPVEATRRRVELTVTISRRDLNIAGDLRIAGIAFERYEVRFDDHPNPATLIGADRRPLVDLSPLFESVSNLHRACYLPAFRNAINRGTNDNYYDIDVGQAFVKRFREWKTGHVIEQNEATVHLIDTIRELFQFSRFDINPSPDDLTLQLFINGRSFRLHELGSGLAQFILVFANVAVKRPAFILIDEPELNLHPSLQVKFLAKLGEYASAGLIYSTHSYGLARSAADQIYSFRKVTEDRSEIALLDEDKSLPALLQELTFSGYRDLGFEKVLLAEGVHDLPVMRHFLRLWRKDARILVLPLGGDALINGKRGLELEELKRIAPHIVAVIDSELPMAGGALAKNRGDFLEACRNSGVECHVLERRAIENYLSDHAVKKTKGESYRALAPFERLADVNPTWTKRENWAIASEMAMADLDGSDLGRILEGL